MFTKTLLIVGMALSCSGALAATHLPVERPAAHDLEHALVNRLLAVDSAADHTLVVGRRGHILVSQDQGQNWEQSPSPVSSDLVDIQMVTPKLGFVVGHDGVVLRTQDAGESWEKVLDGQQAAKLIAQYRAEAAELSEDAQAEYERFEFEGADKPFLTVNFINESTGVVLGAFNYAFITRDAGQSWEPLSHRIENSSGFHIYNSFNHLGMTYAVGEKGLLLRWDPQTERFSALASPYEGSWFGGVSVGEQIVLFGLRGTVFVGSPENGWQEVSINTQDSFNNALALDDARVVLITQSGKLYEIHMQSGQAQVRELEQSGGMPLYDIEQAGNALVAVGARGVRQLPLHNNK